MRLLICLVLFGCVQNELVASPPPAATSDAVATKPALAGRAPGGAIDGGDGADPETTDAAPTPDARTAPPPRPDVQRQQNCLDLWACSAACAQPDDACLQRCYAGAAPDEVAAFRAAADCAMSACPKGDATCRCENECFAGSMCAVAVDACAHGEPVPFCAGGCRR